MDTFAALALATEEPTERLLDEKPASRTDSIFTPVMLRNIIGQAIFQIIVFCSLLFYFRFDHVVYDFIYEETDDCKWFIDAEVEFRKVWVTPAEQANRPTTYNLAVKELEQNRLYECGYKISDMNPTFFEKNSVGLELDKKWRITGDNDVERNPGMSRHYAFLFNTYVYLQIFNEINAKKLLPSENNVFAGLFNNTFFLTILLISMGIQVMIVQIRPVAEFLKMLPLTTPQYFISIGIGASCIIWGKNYSIYYVFKRIRDQADAAEMVRQLLDQGGPSYG